MIDGKNVFDKSAKNDERKYDNIRKIANGHGDNYTTGFLLDYPFYKKHCKMIAINSKKLDADLKAIRQINFTRNLDRAGSTMFSILEEVEETILYFSQGPVIVLNSLCFSIL